MAVKITSLEQLADFIKGKGLARPVIQKLEDDLVEYNIEPDEAEKPTAAPVTPESKSKSPITKAGVMVTQYLRRVPGDVRKVKAFLAGIDKYLNDNTPRVFSDRDLTEHFKHHKQYILTEIFGFGRKNKQEKMSYTAEPTAVDDNKPSNFEELKTALVDVVFQLKDRNELRRLKTVIDQYEGQTQHTARQQTVGGQKRPPTAQ